VHLSAGAVIKEISPTSNRKLTAKVHHLLSQAVAEGKQVDFNTLDNEIGHIIDQEDNDEVEVDFSVGDTIGKVLALIKQVRSCFIYFMLLTSLYQIRMSPQARAFFQDCCRNSGQPEYALLLWIRTRWASVHKALSRVLELDKVCSFLFHQADLI
jgi:hypothetical protein